MTENKITLTKAERVKVMLRSQFLQGSWNYERMQNGGWAYALIPALKKLYPEKEAASAALKRHLEFFNTHPYIAAPILGVTLALEEDRANGVPIDDAAIQGVKVGMMGPLAGIGDPVFWFTVRPILGANIYLKFHRTMVRAHHIRMYLSFLYLILYILRYHKIVYTPTYILSSRTSPIRPP